jgi:hypothetical protein
MFVCTLNSRIAGQFGHEAGAAGHDGQGRWRRHGSPQFDGPDCRLSDNQNPELIDWFNQQDKRWVASFAYMQMRMLSPNEGGTFSTQASRGNMRYQRSSIPDLVWLADLQGRHVLAESPADE